MRNRSVLCVICALLACVASCAATPFGQRDYTSMWWADGFPAVVPGASWKRVIQTGDYAFVLDTETMQVPHFGPVPTGIAYGECGNVPVWKSLPSAGLDLEIEVNGKTFNCSGGGKWTRHGGPRLIESGRFFQRADVTDLRFEAADGERLSTEARFETSAWSDRLGFVFSAGPGEQPIVAGEASFGRVGGGFGLDGTNAFEIPHTAQIDPEQFTLDFLGFRADRLSSF